MFKFHKYSSLGNNFILFDWLSHKDKTISIILRKKNWSVFVQKICDRYFGIGADGVLVIKKAEKEDARAEYLIFNRDGTNGEQCLNGIRCIAHYLYVFKNFQKRFNLIGMGSTIQCGIIKAFDLLLITIETKSVKYLHPLTIQTDNFEISGHVIDCGNPHFVILDRKHDNWLLHHGESIEKHYLFPNRSNVELVHRLKNIDHMQNFSVLTHERGCGMTMACGSGAAATLKTLSKLGIVKERKEIALTMPGGILKSFIHRNKITQIAQAQNICYGVIDTKYSDMMNLI